MSLLSFAYVLDCVKKEKKKQMGYLYLLRCEPFVLEKQVKVFSFDSCISDKGKHLIENRKKGTVIDV